MASREARSVALPLPPKWWREKHDRARVKGLVVDCHNPKGHNGSENDDRAERLSESASEAS